MIVAANSPVEPGKSGSVDNDAILTVRHAAKEFAGGLTKADRSRSGTCERRQVGRRIQIHAVAVVLVADCRDNTTLELDNAECL